MPKEVSFVIRLDDKGTFKKVTVDAEELGRAVRSVQDESEKAKRAVLTWSEASQAIGVLQDTIGELQGVVSDLTSAYQVQLVAETQLQTIMRQRMGATDAEIQSVKDLCSAQQELGVIGDEVQLSGAQQMATFLQNKQSLDVLIPAMNNLVAQQNGLNATNQDAVSIGNMMGKAMQGQVEVLQRVGITFTDAQKQVLQFGNESERAAMLAQVITDNVGNMNAELAKTDAGKWKQTSNWLGDIKEKLGGNGARYSTSHNYVISTYDSRNWGCKALDIYLRISESCLHTYNLYTDFEPNEDCRYCHIEGTFRMLSWRNHWSYYGGGSH